MKKIILFTVYCLLFAICSSSAQVPPDSLAGEYVGQLWYATPPSNPWTIIPDTVYVSTIDTTYCSASYNSTSSFLHNSGGIFNTTYTYCNSAVIPGGYTLFFDTDSLKMIYDDEIQPPPNPHYSFHFYGKRISNKIVGINELTNKEQTIIYPNPVDGMLTINYNIKEGISEIIITDAIGKEVKSVKSKINYGDITIDMSNYKKGIYFLQFKTANTILIKKIIIN
jgi:hypothetical protein